MSKKAKEMFAELGYKQIIDDKYIIYKLISKYAPGYGWSIYLDKEWHTVFICDTSDVPNDIDWPIDMDLLAAINKKVKELRWVDD